MSEGIERGLSLIDSLRGDLEGYYLFHAARADLLRRLGKNADAVDAYGKALGLATNDVERDYLLRRLTEVEGANAN